MTAAATTPRLSSRFWREKKGGVGASTARAVERHLPRCTFSHRRSQRDALREGVLVRRHPLHVNESCRQAAARTELRDFDHAGAPGRHTDHLGHGLRQRGAFPFGGDGLS